MKIKIIILISAFLAFFFLGKQSNISNKSITNHNINSISVVLDHTSISEKKIKKESGKQESKQKSEQVEQKTINYKEIANKLNKCEIGELEKFVDKLSENEVVFLLNKLELVHFDYYTKRLLYKKWGSISPYNAISHLESSKFHFQSRRQDFISEVFDGWLEKNPNELFDTLMNNDSEKIFKNVYYPIGKIFNALAKKDLANSLEILKKYNNKKSIKNPSGSYYIDMISQSDSEAFLHSMNVEISEFFSTADEKKITTIKKKILRRWVQDYPEDAIEWIENISDSSAREDYLGSLFNKKDYREYGHNPVYLYASEAVQHSQNRKEMFDLLYNSTVKNDPRIPFGVLMKNKNLPDFQERIKELSVAFSRRGSMYSLAECLNETDDKAFRDVTIIKTLMEKRKGRDRDYWTTQFLKEFTLSDEEKKDIIDAVNQP